jgi:cytochrome c-type biogenesis protein
MTDSLQLQLYHLEQFANHLVTNQLNHLSLISLGVIFAAGLLTSLTPCTLSMLPITVGYIGGYEAGSRWQSVRQSLCFCLGLATTLTGFGILAAMLGRIYGQVGGGLAIAVSLLAILMGLNLLQILPLRFPSLEGVNLDKLPISQELRTFLVGLTFGLVASPCSTPVLATLLAWISTTHDPWLGAGLLLAYTVGYTTPLLVAGTFTAAIKRFLELRRWSAWITPASGVLLISFGVFSLLTRMFPTAI